MTMPAGWAHEGPDPSVGLFGDHVYHEDCPLAGDQLGAPTETHDLNYVTFTCPCGESIELQTGPDPDDLRDDYDDYWRDHP